MGAADADTLGARNITATNVMAAPVRDVLKQLGEQVRNSQPPHRDTETRAVVPHVLATRA